MTRRINGRQEGIRTSKCTTHSGCYWKLFAAIVFLQYKQDPIYVFPEMKLRGLVSISTFMYLWAIYIFPWSVHQGIGNDAVHVSFLGIFVSNFRYSVFEVCFFKVPSSAVYHFSIHGYMVFCFLPTVFFSRSYFSQFLCWIYFFKLRNLIFRTTSFYVVNLACDLSSSYWTA